MWPGHLLRMSLTVLGHKILATLISWFLSMGFLFIAQGFVAVALLFVFFFFLSHFKISSPKAEDKEKWRNQHVLNNSQRLQGCLFPACNYSFLLFTPDSFIRAWNHFRVTCPRTTGIEYCILRRSPMLRWLEDSVWACRNTQVLSLRDLPVFSRKLQISKTFQDSNFNTISSCSQRAEAWWPLTLFIQNANCWNSELSQWL